MTSPTVLRISRPQPLAKKNSFSPAKPYTPRVSPTTPTPPSLSNNATSRKKRSILRAIKHMQTSGQEVVLPHLRSLPSLEVDQEQVFPTLFKPATLRSLLEECQDMNEVHEIAKVFVQWLDAFTDTMDRLPNDVRAGSMFRMARHDALFNKHLFVAHISQPSTNLSSDDVKEGIQIAVELLERNMASWKTFLQVAENTVVRESLPELPGDRAPNRAIKPTPAPVTDPLLAIVETSEGDKDVSTRNDAPSSPPSVTRKPSMLARFLARAGRVDLSPLSQNIPQALSGLVDIDAPSVTAVPGDQVLPVDRNPQADLGALPCEGEGSSQGEDALARSFTLAGEFSQIGLRPVRTKTGSRYSIRDSLFIFPDPAAPECDVQLPRPGGDVLDMHLNSDGILTKASLSALIIMLTSKECVIDPEFTDMFFLCFRFFSSPMEVFKRLLGRCEEEPPGSLSAAQSRVWASETSLVKFRVAKILHTWLDLHWRHDMDEEIFEPLLSFTFDRLAKELPICLTTKLADALIKCAAHRKSYRGRRLRKRIEMTEMALKLEDTRPTGFDHCMRASMSQGNFTRVDILDFHTECGREELARQLTLKASRLYCLIDPEDAVSFWRDKKNKKVGGKITAMITFEKAMFVWVIHTILGRPTPAARAMVMTFWLDLASICVQLRNFSVALSILSAVENSPVFRLRQTIEEAFRSHRQKYDELEKLFAASGNYGSYRATLRSSEMPTVPLLRVLARDIYATNELASLVELSPQSGNFVINVSSYRIIAKTVRAMELCHVPYKFRSFEYLQAWLDHALHDFMDPENEGAILREFDERSLFLEPRQTNAPSLSTPPLGIYNHAL